MHLYGHLPPVKQMQNKIQYLVIDRRKLQNMEICHTAIFILKKRNTVKQTSTATELQFIYD